MILPSGTQGIRDNVTNPRNKPLQRIGYYTFPLCIFALTFYLYVNTPVHAPISLQPETGYLAVAVPHALELGDGPNLAHANGPVSGSSWWREGVVVVQNVSIAPDGTKTADELVETTGNGRHRIGTKVDNVVSGEIYTVSVYVQSAGRHAVQLEMAGAPKGAYGRVQFDLAQRAAMAQAGDVSDLDIQQLPGGWYRCSATMRYNARTATFNFSVMTEPFEVIYSGNSKSGLLMWGVQFEPGNQPRGYSDKN